MWIYIRRDGTDTHTHTHRLELTYLDSNEKSGGIDLSDQIISRTDYKVLNFSFIGVDLLSNIVGWGVFCVH